MQPTAVTSPRVMQSGKGDDMYTVEVYNKDRVIVETKTFNTYEEATDYADNYFIGHYTYINNEQYDLLDKYNFDPSSLYCDCPEEDAA